jgi:hypothetical protein
MGFYGEIHSLYIWQQQYFGFAFAFNEWQMFLQILIRNSVFAF